VKSNTSPEYIKSIDVHDTNVGGENFTLKLIPPENANPKDWMLKVKSGGETIEHSSDPLSVRLYDSSKFKSITEIAVGEKTAHKVYNSYR
jgi:hypothetical protein